VSVGERGKREAAWLEASALGAPSVTAIADALEGRGTVRPLKARPKRDRSGADVARAKRKPRRRSADNAADQGGKVVELMGLEPTTPCLQSRCSSN